MEETKLKELLKEAFEAGRDYQYTINPYSGKPSMFSNKPSFIKWYNAKLKLLGIGAVVGRSGQFKCDKCGSDWGSVVSTCYSCNHESEGLST